MLTLILPGRKVGFDEATGLFVMTPEKVFHLEHCLWAMAEWESETGLCFQQTQLRGNQIILYVMCMVHACGGEILLKEAENLINLYSQKILKYVYSERHAKKPVPDYVIKAERTRAQEQNKQPEFQPTEQIYAAMFDLHVDISCDRWHFSRLLSLFEYINEREKQKSKGTKGKRKSTPNMTSSAASRMDAVNSARRKARGN